MIKAFLESLEDPNRPLLGPNFWLMKKIGLLLPKKFQQKFWKIIMHECIVVFVLSQYMELFVIRSDKDLVLKNLTISLLSPIVVFKAHSFVFWQDNWRQVFDYITEADKFERNNQDETKAKIINSYTKYCRRVTYFYWALTFTTNFTTCTTPLIKYITSLELREGLRNGTEIFPHIFISWMPFDKESFPGLWITILWHVYICTVGATVMASYDTSFMVSAVFFSGQLDLLRVRCREMLGMNGIGISDEQADRGVRQVQQMHMLLLKHSRLLNSLLSPVMFFYVVLCSLLICATAYQITSSTNITQRLFIAQYLVFGIAQLFLFCWHSNDVMYKSNEVRLGPYESEWWAASLNQRNKVLILQGQMQIEHIYTAGPFTNLTIATFITILKGAYSYYTLISNK